jgi:thiamine pyrophosphokinase
MTFSALRDDKAVLPSQMVYGDVRSKSLDEIYQYYRLSAKQRKEVRWIIKEHLSNYCELQGVQKSDYHHSITFTRLGSSPQEKWLVITSSIWYIADLDLKFRESRHIKIGVNGGKILLNPERRGTFVSGKAVLRVPAKAGM